MGKLFQKQLTQLFVVAVVMAAVGAIAVQVVFTGAPEDQIPTGPERVVLTSPLSTGEAGGGRRAFGAASDATKSVFLDELPLEAASALSAGWKDSLVCEEGRGRIFQKSGQQDVPYLLMYNNDNRLLGLYLYSMSPMPDVLWVQQEELTVGGLTIIESKHWAMVLYIRDSATACETSP